MSQFRFTDVRVLERRLERAADTVDLFSGRDFDEMSESERDLLQFAQEVEQDLVDELRSRRRMSVVRRVLEDR